MKKTYLLLTSASLILCIILVGCSKIPQEYYDDWEYCQQDSDCISYDGRCSIVTKNMVTDWGDYFGPPCRFNPVYTNYFEVKCINNGCEVIPICETFCPFANNERSEFIEVTNDCTQPCSEKIDNPMESSSCSQTCDVFKECNSCRVLN
ncbi:hypothetical protein HOK51_10970 [Candidatus Woesearchaeota archaeon]|jgi:hypothetical protein|nr:hypothetical protein [Candidatus Woesearchaeota archaeon]MBT6520343.1 hypothetical protein [Candidatus Woesearchaeota archaeon]MBT7368296.1 hypothetical protein [Candidatus Woesearchaeota archaeon]